MSGLARALASLPRSYAGRSTWSVIPVASGTPGVGNTLTCSAGTVSGTTNRRYQWKRGDVAIAAATASTYVQVAADIGPAITCTSYADSATGTSESTSNALQMLPTTVANCVWWMRPGLDTITKDGSNRVSAMLDLSAAAHNTTQGTGSAQLLYTASDAAYNGVATLVGDGARDLTSGNFTALPQPLTMFFTGHDASGTSPVIMMYGTTGGYFEFDVISGYVAGYPGSTIAQSAAPLATSKVVACFVMNGASSEVYVNDSVTARVTGGSGTSAPVNFHVGHTAPYGFNGTVAEEVVYSRQLTNAERKDVMLYLGWRSGKAVT